MWNVPDPAADAPATAAALSTVVDVLVVYTPGARMGAGGTPAIEALIDLAEAETNVSYANSGVSQRLRVVHSAEVAYTESGSLDTDVARLRATTDGFIDGVHALRNTYGADFVSLWITAPGCGISYLMTSVSSSFAASAFNVCQYTCATGNLTFGHELGHNMSLRHDWYIDAGTSPYIYNHGFVHTDSSAATAFRTVMAYGNRCVDTFGTVCSRLLYFANPDVLVGGNAAGVPPGTSSACSAGVAPITECDADSRLALNSAAAVTTAFRPTTVLARIIKEVDVSTAIVGDTITYTLTVTNDSPVTADAIVITDTVPDHSTLDLFSLSLDASAAGTTPGSLITWNTGTNLTSGNSLVRTFSVTATEGGTVTNMASVDSSSTALTMTSNTVSTSIWKNIDCGFQDGFETGALSNFWRVDLTQDGRVRVLSDAPDTGTYSAVLDDAVADSTTSTAALVLAANLAGAPVADLAFRWAEAGDENGAADGVFIREAESDPWINVLNFANSPDLVYQDATIDLVQAAATNLLSLTDGFQIRFQFSDNWTFIPGNPAGGDGYLIDNVSLSCDCTHELMNMTVSGPTPVLEESPCVILAGPDYTVDRTGILTLRSAQRVALRSGFSVLTGGQLTVEN